jgi:NodT family efflux transporter outer membrane factor (OMF) lipoprotein
MRLARLSIVGLALSVGACAVGPAYRVPKPDTPAAFAGSDTVASRASAAASGVPGTSAPGDLAGAASGGAASVASGSAAAAGAGSTAAAAGAPVDIAAWWRALDDPELDSLVERAVTSNLDIAMALDRLQQARNYEAVVAGHALPEVDAAGAAGRGTGSDLTKGLAPQALRAGDDTAGLKHINTLVGFDTVWELDFFGKYRREFQAARAEAQAARAARYEVLVSVVADVARTYVDLRGLQVRLKVLREAADAMRESLRIESIRYERGIINELDVALAKRELASMEAQIAPLAAQESAARYTLAVLLGEYPENIGAELSAPALIPSMPAPAAAGTPLDLLERRPDIREAERRLAAATARIGVATANLYPQVVIAGALGSQGQNWASTPVIGQHIWSFGAGALWPLIDFGALDAQVNIASLAAHEQMLAYRKTILGAVAEVDTALDAYGAQSDRLANLSEAMLAAQRALELATARYNRGLTDYLNVVDAQRQLYDLEDEYALAQVAQGEDFVQLYKSLGGGWQNYQKVPAIRRPEPAIVAAFRRVLDNPAPVQGNSTPTQSDASPRDNADPSPGAPPPR